ncbi:MAG: carboxypeptidase regulatory-like domain-containing protein [Acidobacteriota bacterium]
MTQKRCLLALLVLFSLCLSSGLAQTVTGSVGGRVLDASGAVLPGATVTAENRDTGIVRTVVTSDTGDFRIPLLPVGSYSVSAEVPGFKREVKTDIQLKIGQVVTLEFTLQVGEITEEVVVRSNLVQLELEPTRTQTSSIIDTVQIENLPTNGRQFIDFALLAPGVNIGETTSGSTDVVIEPVTKLAFAGQNIHFNFIAVDGADDISTASGVQRASPPQDSVQEFRVINSNFYLEFGRAVGGIVNIITKSGTNEFHGSAYDFFRNDALDARGILASPKPGKPGEFLDELRQNQFGVSMGGPIARDRSFFFANYEGQRRGQSPFYNSVVTNNIDAINDTKVNLFGLPAEQLNVLNTRDTDNLLLKADHAISDRHSLFVRYFLVDERSRNISPLNDGSDLPSAFKNNFLRDQSVVANVNSSFSPRLLNEFRAQFARRSFDFPVTTTQPALEFTNTFKTGINRGNPEFYRETRVEALDNVTFLSGDHSVSFGGNFNFVRTNESFQIFHPFEAQFASLDDFLNGNPAIFFFSKLNINDTGFDPALLRGSGPFSPSTLDTFRSEVNHTYSGMFIQDKWQATPNLTLNYGARWEFETWPDGFVNTDWNNIDPRFGFAYNASTQRKFVIRGGIGVFHGIIPSPLLMVQQACCGGLNKFPGREAAETDVNGNVPVFLGLGFDENFNIDNASALQRLLTDGTFPFIIGSFPIVRFTKDHQAPYGLQATFSLGFEIFPDTALQLTYLAVRGVHLGSFFNINTPLQPSGKLESGKDDFAAVRFNRFASLPGARDPRFALFFEADSRWNSIYHGFLVNLNRRFREHFGLGVSYTYSKTIDDGPNPSFVLIPENANRLDLERARSSDDVRHRFVTNATLATSSTGPVFTRDWNFGVILTLRTPHGFTKFAGFDANGEGFPVNDRVGLDARNTFEGDSFSSLDARISRSFPLTENVKGEFIAEAFNVFNSVNIRFFNTVYGDSIFNAPGTPGTFFQGARSPSFGTPRAIFNPRQIQFAFRVSW